MDFQPGDYFSHADINCLKRKSEGFGVLSGCIITPSSANLSVTIGTGSVVVGYGTSSSVVVFTTSNTVSLSSNIYYPRKAIIHVTSNGVLTSSLGVAEVAVPPGKIGRQTQYPMAPSIPSDSTQLAEVWMPAGALTGNDLSLYVSNPLNVSTPMTANGTATVSAGQLYTIASHSLPIIPPTESIMLKPMDDLLGRYCFVTDCSASTFKINISSRDTIAHIMGWGVSI